LKIKNFEFRKFKFLKIFPIKIFSFFFGGKIRRAHPRQHPSQIPIYYLLFHFFIYYFTFFRWTVSAAPGIGHKNVCLCKMPNRSRRSRSRRRGGAVSKCRRRGRGKSRKRSRSRSGSRSRSRSRKRRKRNPSLTKAKLIKLFQTTLNQKVVALEKNSDMSNEAAQDFVTNLILSKSSFNYVPSNAQIYKVQVPNRMRRHEAVRALKINEEMKKLRSEGMSTPSALIVLLDRLRRST